MFSIPVPGRGYHLTSSEQNLAAVCGCSHHASFPAASLIYMFPPRIRVCQRTSGNLLRTSVGNAAVWSGITTAVLRYWDGTKSENPWPETSLCFWCIASILNGGIWFGSKITPHPKTDLRLLSSLIPYTSWLQKHLWFCMSGNSTAHKMSRPGGEVVEAVSVQNAVLSMLQCSLVVEEEDLWENIIALSCVG